VESGSRRRKLVILFGGERDSEKWEYNFMRKGA